MYFVTHRDCVHARAIADFQCFYLLWLRGYSFSSTSLSDDWKSTKYLQNHSSLFSVAECTRHYSKLSLEQPHWYVVFACRITLVSLHCTTSVPAEFFSLMTAKDPPLCYFILFYVLLLLSLITFPQISSENSLFGLIYGNDIG